MKIKRSELYLIIERYLREQDETAEDETTPVEDETTPVEDEAEPFDFVIRILDVPLEFSVKFVNGKAVPKIDSDDSKANSLISSMKPMDYLAIAYEKMKELVGFEDNERKKTFDNIGKFIKQYDISTVSETAVDIFNEKKKDISKINFSMQKIKEKLTSKM